MSQTSADTEWNPIKLRIIELAIFDSACNFAVVYVVLKDAAVGIAYLNRGTTTAAYIKNSVNSGEINCGSQYRNIYAAGICLSTSGAIESCKN